MLDIDDVIKAIKCQRSFGPMNDRPICERCGAPVMIYAPTESDIRMGESYRYATTCGACGARALVAAQQSLAEKDAKPAKKRAPICRYCWRKRTLVGAWCRTCRNNHQRKIIREALTKVTTGQELTWQDEQTLAMAPYWAIWKKEFRKGKAL